MAKSRKSRPVKKRKTKRKKSKKVAPVQSETAIQVVQGEIVSDEPVKRGFRIPANIRVEVIALHILQVSAEKIAERLSLAKGTVLKIIHESPEKEGITNAMQTAGTIELMKAIPIAVKSLTDQIESGDGGLALAMLRGLQLLNPRAEIVASAKDGEFDDWTVGELTLFLETGEKPKGK